MNRPSVVLPVDDGKQKRERWRGQSRVRLSSQSSKGGPYLSLEVKVAPDFRFTAELSLRSRDR